MENVGHFSVIDGPQMQGTRVDSSNPMFLYHAMYKIYLEVTEP